MEQNSVVPDVIDKVPPNIIKVNKINIRSSNQYELRFQITYPSGVRVNLGNELTPTLVKDEPKLEWPVEAGALYTLCMTDPDAPSRKDPKFGQIKHWLVVNIPGLQINKGETLAAYVGSGPPKDTDLHRYVFLVYKQPGIITHSETPVSNSSTEGRRSFKIRDFAKKYNLGEPIAANFYQAQYDDYVPILHAQIGVGR